jgi:hypothetical protein
MQPSGIDANGYPFAVNVAWPPRRPRGEQVRRVTDQRELADRRKGGL